MASLPSYVLFFLLLVGPLVLIHEFGHFAAAKLCRIKVVRFSFGFGPRILGFRHGETDYRLSLLPLGGYVKMAGDNPAEPLAAEDRGRGFLEASPWKRAFIAFAGPAMNLILPIVVFFALGVAGAHDTLAPQVGQVLPGSPAARAGLRSGDVIDDIGGTKVTSFESLRELIGSRAGIPLDFRISRDGQPMSMRITPESFEETDDLETTHRAVIGFRPLPLPATIGIPDPASPAGVAGLRTFDRAIRVDGTVIDSQLDLERALAKAWAAGVPVNVEVVRGRALGYSGLGPGVPEVVHVTLPAPASGAKGYGVEADDLFVRWVIPRSPAAEAGIQRGDELVGMDGAPLESWWGLEDTLQKKQTQPVTLLVRTPGHAPREIKMAQRTLDLGESPVTGIDVKALGMGFLHDGEPLLPSDQTMPRDWIYPKPRTIQERMPIWEVAQKSVGATWEVIRKEVLGIVRIFQGRVSVKKLGGPIMIADVARQAAANGLEAFLFMMTLVSVNLGLVNLLPLPVLDGGHIATAMIESIQRKPLSRRAYELTNAFGFALLVALMLFVLVNDVVQKHIFGQFP